MRVGRFDGTNIHSHTLTHTHTVTHTLTHTLSHPHTLTLLLLLEAGEDARTSFLTCRSNMGPDGAAEGADGGPD